MNDLADRLSRIPWSSIHHSESQAAEIPERIAALFSRDELQVYEAIRYLEDKLCHQWGAVLPALKPTFPFLIEALKTEQYSDNNLDALLEFLHGVAKVAYSRRGDMYSSSLHIEFREMFAQHLCEFEKHRQHHNRDTAELADFIASNIKGTYEYDDFPF